MNIEEMIQISKFVTEGIEKTLGAEISGLREDVKESLTRTGEQAAKSHEFEKTLLGFSYRIEKVEIHCEKNEKEINNMNTFLKSLQQTVADLKTALNEILKNVKLKKAIILGIIASPTLVAIVTIALPWIAKALKWIP
jgi:predicted nuclease with TOPRIM domain